MVVSIVTVCYQAEATLAEAMQSVLVQIPALPEGWRLEYLVVDGASTDGTLAIAQSFPSEHVRVVSEPDEGLYDAMNKGVRLATGNVVGILNADDAYAHDRVLAEVLEALERTGADGAYGDLDYVDGQDPSKVVRRWKAGDYVPGAFRRGWMPPHPTLFLTRRCYADHGLFNVTLRSAADYELMLRMIHRHHIQLTYLPRTLVRMRTGGTSNATWSNRWKAHLEDWQAWRLNGYHPSPWTLLAKPLRKLPQFLTRS